MALVTLTDLETEVSPVDVHDDTIPPTLANFETNPANAQENFSTVFSMLSHLRDVQVGDWYDALTAPTTLETGVARGVQDNNEAVHLVEKKRILRDVHNLTDITVGGTDNFVILDGGAAELPANTTASLGVTNTLGTIVAAHGGTFGTHALDEVAGPNTLNPDNLCAIFDGATRDPILSGGSTIWGLLQSESGISDGTTITLATTTRVQLSFVIVNGTGDDLIACPAVDIQGKSINYCSREQVRFEDLTRSDFLKGAIIDTPGGSTVDRQRWRHFADQYPIGRGRVRRRRVGKRLRRWSHFAQWRYAPDSGRHRRR
jgi:hypothetical protein